MSLVVAPAGPPRSHCLVLAVKLLVDTDLGTDGDDAICLAYLLRQPRAELLAILG